MDKVLFEKRFNEIRPDYDIQFGTDYLGMGFELDEFTVDAKGRTTMKVTEEYLSGQFAIHYRTYVRHPRLSTKEINYLLGKEEN